MSSSAKQRFLDNYDREHERTVRVLRAYPADKLDLKPHEMSKSARDLAWIFFLERALITRVWHDELFKGIPPSGAIHARAVASRSSAPSASSSVRGRPPTRKRFASSASSADGSRSRIGGGASSCRTPSRPARTSAPSAR